MVCLSNQVVCSTSSRKKHFVASSGVNGRENAGRSARDVPWPPVDKKGGNKETQGMSRNVMRVKKKSQGNRRVITRLTLPCITQYIVRSGLQEHSVYKTRNVLISIPIVPSTGNIMIASKEIQKDECIQEKEMGQISSLHVKGNVGA